MKKRAIILVSLLCLLACVRETNKHNISKYVTIDPATSEEIFWYLIEDINSSSISYVTSPKPITNFSNVNWTNSPTKPPELANEEPEETIEAEIDTDADAEAEGVDSDSDSAASDGGSDAGGDSGGDGGGDGGGGE